MQIKDLKSKEFWTKIWNANKWTILLLVWGIITLIAFRLKTFPVLKIILTPIVIFFMIMYIRELKLQKNRYIMRFTSIYYMLIFLTIAGWIIYTALFAKAFDLAAWILIAVFILFLIWQGADILTGLITINRNMVFIILSYIAFSFISICFFWVLYVLSGGLESMGGGELGGGLDSFYFSAQVFYSDIPGNVLVQGSSRLIKIVELAYGTIVHIVVLGVAINNLRKSPEHKKDIKYINSKSTTRR
jgi:hypothetical protein